MNTWIRRDFQAAGLTQYPVGPHLASIQQQFGGVVVLCIDVSGSMHGTPLASAVRGAEKFAKEAIAAHYEVGVVLWNQTIAARIDPTTKLKAVLRFLQHASSSGGTDINDALTAAHDVLRPRDTRLDRVVAIFGDGDLGDRTRAVAKATIMRAEDIRILTLGLGDSAARALDEISSEANERPRTATADTIDTQIAGLTTGLHRR